MTAGFPNSAPAPHRSFVQDCVRITRGDRRIVGVAAGGSYLTDTMDEFSDLDLVIVVESGDYADVMAGRRQIAESLGSLVGAFTGEHIGHPRLLICLYAEPLLHVDLDFVTLADLENRDVEPKVLWERKSRLSAALQARKPHHPAPDGQWIEDRFWIWVHYAATKIGRGELFEAIGFLAYLRATVLAPLAVSREGGCPAGVRRVETLVPAFARDLHGTLAGYDRVECLRALRTCVDLYRAVRTSPVGAETVAAERMAMEYLSQLVSRYDPSS